MLEGYGTYSNIVERILSKLAVDRDKYSYPLSNDFNRGYNDCVNKIKEYIQHFRLEPFEQDILDELMLQKEVDELLILPQNNIWYSGFNACMVDFKNSYCGPTSVILSEDGVSYMFIE